MIVETSMSLLRHLVQILFYLAGDVFLQLLCALIVMNATRFVEFPVLVAVHIYDELIHLPLLILRQAVVFRRIR